MLLLGHAQRLEPQARAHRRSDHQDRADTRQIVGFRRLRAKGGGFRHLPHLPPPHTPSCPPHEVPLNELKGHSGALVFGGGEPFGRRQPSPTRPPPHTYPFIGYVGVVGGGCRTSVLMPGAGQDKTVAAKMAAPHTGGSQFIAADARGAAVGMQSQQVAPSRRADYPHGRFELPSRGVPPSTSREVREDPLAAKRAFRGAAVRRRSLGPTTSAPPPTLP